MRGARALALLVALAACRRPTHDPPQIKPDPSAHAVALTTASIDVSSKKIDAWDGTAYECGDVVQVHGLVRESVPVRVDGACEWWSLEWRETPTKACSTRDHRRACDGVRYGESAGLDLVARRGGIEVERLALDPYFRGYLPIVRRWAEQPGDGTIDAGWSDDHFYEDRPTDRALVLRDFDHDGGATEFALPTPTTGANLVLTYAIGRSKTDRRLHAFTTSDRPKEPLVFGDPSVWRDLAAAHRSPTTAIERDCYDGEHGQLAIEFAWNAAGLRATRTERVCDPDNHVGAIVSTETL